MFAHKLQGRHIMIDGETAATGGNCAFVQLSAVEWWPAEPERRAERHFDAYIDLRSSFRAGRTLDPDTFLWWMDDEEGAGREARQELVHGLRYRAIPWREALEGLEGLLRAPIGRGLGAKPEGLAGVWSHGAAFDVSRLETAYADQRMKCPWDFGIQQDTRTLFKLVGKRLADLAPPRHGTKHNSLPDCHQQIEACHAALAIINGVDPRAQEGEKGA